jgi:hypothetical protein
MGSRLFRLDLFTVHEPGRAALLRRLDCPLKIWAAQQRRSTRFMGSPRAEPEAEPQLNPTGDWSMEAMTAYFSTVVLTDSRPIWQVRN